MTFSLARLLSGTQYLRKWSMNKTYPTLLDPRFMNVSPVKRMISSHILSQIDVRVGTIEHIEEIPRSDKLVRLMVDFGDHKRRILAGIKNERENPREIEGKQALFVVNLEPKKMMGELSEGMLFDIGYGDGITPVLAVPEKPVPNGTRAA
jgi:tRNA-binding protein